tara:strand:+ start:1523 stop:1762 length:240 start_codon:yes stop_codon:yes gene_type:complete
MASDPSKPMAKKSYIASGKTMRAATAPARQPTNPEPTIFTSNITNAPAMPNTLRLTLLRKTAPITPPTEWAAIIVALTI